MKLVNVHSTHRIDEYYPDLAVAVLAGGASRRFGADKALVTLCPNGATLIELAVSAGRSVAAATFVVGHERYAPYLPGVPIVSDDRPGEGPLAGIQAALRFTSAQRVLVLACDMPCLSTPLLRWMAAIETNADVLIPRTADGQWQPMPAIYSRSAIGGIEHALDEGNRAVASIFQTVTVQEIGEPDLRALDPELRSFFSLNHPDQLDCARQCVSCR